MGYNIKNQIVIEFYGMPGSGKSTISHIIAERIREKKTVMEPSYEIDHCYCNVFRKIMKFCKYIMFIASSYKKHKQLKSIIINNGICGMDVFRHEMNIAYKILAYQKKADYIMFDEGLVQSAISIANGKTDCLENEKELLLLANHKKIIKIYIKTALDEALKRMNERCGNDSRIEKIKNPIRRRGLLSNIEMQCESIDGIVINGNLPLKENVETILKEIGEV